jgi:hypothetical protein
LSFTDADREQLFRRLSAHAAADHIDLDELERRIARVTEARTRDAALAVIADLPALPALPGEDAAGGGGPVSGRARWGRGHGEADAPRGDWRPTGERFRDPRTGKVMRVWEDAARQRHYVVDDERG